MQKTEAEMLRTKNFGRKSLNEIKEILSGLGLTFGMKFDAQGRLVSPAGTPPRSVPLTMRERTSMISMTTKMRMKAKKAPLRSKEP